VAVFGMSEPDVALAVQQPWVSFNNDSQGTAPTGLLGQEHPHPRAYGTFPRVLKEYVRDAQVLSLPEAIRRMTSAAAAQFHVLDRGTIRPGMFADLVVFDPALVADPATYEKPHQYAIGIPHVIVNGVPAVLDGKVTDARPGRVLVGAEGRKTTADRNARRTGS